MSSITGRTLSLQRFLCLCKEDVSFSKPDQEWNERSSAEGRRIYAGTLSKQSKDMRQEKGLRICFWCAWNCQGIQRKVHSVVVRRTICLRQCGRTWSQGKEKLSEGGGLPSCVALVDVSGSMGYTMECCCALTCDCWGGTTSLAKPKLFYLSQTLNGIRLLETVCLTVSKFDEAPWGVQQILATPTWFLTLLLRINARSIWGIVCVFGYAVWWSRRYGIILSWYTPLREELDRVLVLLILLQTFGGHSGSWIRDATIVFWNLNGRCSAGHVKPSLMESFDEWLQRGYVDSFHGRTFDIDAGKTPTDLMLEVLDGERYECTCDCRAGSQKQVEEGKSDS